MTDQQINEILTAIALVGTAIKAKDWARARRIWDELTRTRPELIDSNPHVAGVLRNKEAVVYPHSDSIH